MSGSGGAESRISAPLLGQDPEDEIDRLSLASEAPKRVGAASSMLATSTLSVQGTQAVRVPLGRRQWRRTRTASLTSATL